MRRYEAPFTSSTVPLVNSASGEARKSTAAATSSARRDAAERALGAAGVAARAGQLLGRHVGLGEAGRDRRDRDAVRPPSERASDWPNAISPALLAP